jgi:hypothetical protein
MMGAANHLSHGKRGLDRQERLLSSERHVQPRVTDSGQGPATARNAIRRKSVIKNAITGYIYIAGSKSARLLKVRTCVDIEQRGKNLRHQRYGNVSDWEMLFTAKVDTGGRSKVPPCLCCHLTRSCARMRKTGRSRKRRNAENEFLYRSRGNPGNVEGYKNFGGQEDYEDCGL